MILLFVCREFMVSALCIDYCFSAIPIIIIPNESIDLPIHSNSFLTPLKNNTLSTTSFCARNFRKCPEKLHKIQLLIQIWMKLWKRKGRINVVTIIFVGSYTFSSFIVSSLFVYISLNMFRGVFIRAPCLTTMWTQVKNDIKKKKTKIKTELYQERFFLLSGNKQPNGIKPNGSQNEP